MLDVWEVRYGFNFNDLGDVVKDCNGDGYINIEKYINGIDFVKKVNWMDIKNNYDILVKCKSLM